MKNFTRYLSADSGVEGQNVPNSTPDTPTIQMTNSSDPSGSAQVAFPKLRQLGRVWSLNSGISLLFLNITSVSVADVVQGCRQPLKWLNCKSGCARRKRPKCRRDAGVKSMARNAITASANASFDLRCATPRRHQIRNLSGWAERRQTNRGCI